MPQREDPALLPALPVLTETLTVEDPRIPGKTFDFLFSITVDRTESDSWFVLDRQIRLETEYVDTDKRIDVNGQFIPVEKKDCMHIALFMEAEILATGESWNFREWMVWKHKAATAFVRLIEAYNEMYYRARPYLLPKDENKDEDETSQTDEEESIPKNA